jgi:stage III sporulation protein AE
VNLKTELAYSADSLTLKGIKMLSGSVVPVIGSTIGEALNSVIGAVALIKSTLGVFAIIAVALTCLPTVTQLLLWHFSIYLCSAVSDALNLTSVSKALKVITGLISIICIILVTIMLIFILTAGNMISLRG